ncbi:MAG TPA: nucleoside triphosphate pyrophosphohydrolase [Candidatus Paceibacterota bacterium]
MKLVRDKLPEIIASNGRGEIPRWHRIEDDQEFRGELLAKLLEEVREVMGATTPEARRNECADVAEVMIALLALQGVTRRQFMRVLRDRRQERGGFEGRIFLEKVDPPPSSEPLFAK